MEGWWGGGSFYALGQLRWGRDLDNLSLLQCVSSTSRQGPSCPKMIFLAPRRLPTGCLWMNIATRGPSPTLPKAVCARDLSRMFKTLHGCARVQHRWVEITGAEMVAMSE